MLFQTMQIGDITILQIIVGGYVQETLLTWKNKAGKDEKIGLICGSQSLQNALEVAHLMMEEDKAE
jgi:hypothetical protein